MSVTFPYPWHYSFAPFFTLQPNHETRRAQLNAWQQLILSYCEFHKIFELHVQNDGKQALFTNKSIDRHLSVEAIKVVLEEMRRNATIEWTDKSCLKCYVYWKSPEEWSRLIYKWATDKALINSVCTLYEIVSSDDTNGCEFHGLNDHILMKALTCLEKQGKAAIISFDDNKGVKFL